MKDIPGIGLIEKIIGPITAGRFHRIVDARFYKEPALEWVEDEIPIVRLVLSSHQEPQFSLVVHFRGVRRCRLSLLQNAYGACIERIPDSDRELARWKAYDYEDDAFDIAAYDVTIALQFNPIVKTKP